MLDCIVVGAGPCGLVAVKELLGQGVKNIKCLEKSKKLGGIFSESYDNLTLTSSSTFSMFSDFWIGDNQNNKFWTKDEAVAYWTQYAEYFGVSSYIEYDSEVEKIKPVKNENGKSWIVKLCSGELFKCRRVVIAAGNNRNPKFPEWKDSLDNIKYSHSISYKNADRFKDKRVLVVGGGESGSDLALEISRVAQKCWVSLRNSTGWVVPRKRGDIATDNSTNRAIWNLPISHGKHLSKRLIERELNNGDPVFDAVADLNKLADRENGIRGIYGTKTLALPQAMANYGCEIVRAVTSVEDENRKVYTSDGKILENIDEVVFCTGYKSHIGFLPKAYQKVDPRALYKHMLHPEMKDQIAWLGLARAGFGSQFPIMEMQARLLALIVSKKHDLPSTPEMERITSIDRAGYLERFHENACRIRSLVDYHCYMDDMAKVIGCEPPIKKYFFLKPKLWIRIVFGPTQATQFRLRGPGKNITVAHQILNKLPDIKFNKIIKEGIEGRIRYMLPGYKFWMSRNQPVHRK